ncbi:YfcE family phosphodiesterase [Subtercola sp. Z020]|uniref:metallophosphoesterase family protein n=1 Tax=Subtercola sp. Z020 TaxID=2080582 RepID=UPI000CE8FA77|nr:metallophosphoesterase [Subtercola sp. Z020]PPF78735.1 YfcE family phosphodiesterase [Subtercola sp. Z020]
MARILLISDTHLPKRARDLPAELWSAVDAADVVFHAGDWVDLATYERLAARVEASGGELVGVWGNNDPPELRAVLPEVARVDVAGLRFAMTHETGSAAGRERRADLAFPRGAVAPGAVGVAGAVGAAVAPGAAGAAGAAVATGADVLVFGHSHIPWDTTTPAGLRLLNPGSPTDRRRQPHCTYLTAHAAAGALTDVTLHRLPQR